MPAFPKDSHPRNSTLSKLYVHLIFAVKGKESHILPQWERALYRYMGGIIHNKGQQLLAINGTSDHLHLLVAIKASCRLSDLVREIKKSTNRYIRRRHWTSGPFYWQEGYGAFSYAPSTLSQLKRHIQRQKEYHQRASFQTEYKTLLQHFDIPYESIYLFDWTATPSHASCKPCCIANLQPVPLQDSTKITT